MRIQVQASIEFESEIQPGHSAKKEQVNWGSLCLKYCHLERFSVQEVPVPPQQLNFKRTKPNWEFTVGAGYGGSGSAYSGAAAKRIAQLSRGLAADMYHHLPASFSMEIPAVR
jgi:hypothetical protein